MFRTRDFCPTPLKHKTIFSNIFFIDWIAPEPVFNRKDDTSVTPRVVRNVESYRIIILVLSECFCELYINLYLTLLPQKTFLISDPTTVRSVTFVLAACDWGRAHPCVFN